MEDENIDDRIDAYRQRQDEMREENLRRTIEEQVYGRYE